VKWGGYLVALGAAGGRRGLEDASIVVSVRLDPDDDAVRALDRGCGGWLG
jgi:hypothetical protein